MTKRYTDEQILSSIQLIWLKSACGLTLSNYTDGTHKIWVQDYTWRNVRAFACGIEGIPSATVIRRCKQLESQGLVIIPVRRPGSVWCIHPTEQEAKRLIDLAYRWWESIGYDRTVTYARSPLHHIPSSEPTP